MKLVIVIITACFLQVSAASRAQQVTLNETGASLKTVFREIEHQTNYTVLVQSEQLANTHKVTVNLKNVPLKAALNTLLDDQGLSYTIEDKAIVIKIKEKPIVAYNGNIALELPPDSVLYTGHVLDESGNPLVGATIHLKGSNYGSVSVAPNGYFERRGNTKSILVITYIGYATQEYGLSKQDPNKPINIKMQKGTTDLQEVAIVNDGYQSLPKERATGSYEVITAKDLQHSTSPSLLKRLEGITTSLNFNNQLTPTNSALVQPGSSEIDHLTIRGKNTLNLNSTSYPLTEYGSTNSSGIPLVVIDGIASPYTIDQVNPNDVENITILKDAAAASIWGSRAANGVIVITTKKGTFNKKARISFNTNVTIQDKPDLFYNKEMTTSDFVDAETYAFKQAGVTTSDPNLSTAQPLMSPIQEILNAQQLGHISQSMATSMLDSLRGNDVRRDLGKYFYRKAVTQSYGLSVDGGSAQTTYRLGVDYDKSLNNTIANESDRTNISYSMSTKPWKKLQLGGTVNYSIANTDAQSENSRFSGVAPYMTPYTRLVDNAGNSIPVVRDYRPSFVNLLESTYGSHIENLDYTPLSDINQGYLKYKNEFISVNLNGIYTLSKVFSFNLTYNYTRSDYGSTNYDSPNSYYMRNLFDLFTDPNSFSHAVPTGGLLQSQGGPANNETLRGQVNINKTWHSKNEFNAIIGTELTNSITNFVGSAYYGYDPNTLRTTPNLNYQSFNTLLFGAPYTGLNSEPIPNTVNGEIVRSQARTYSAFTSGTYTYDDRYALSFSARQDANSEFGTSTNSSFSPYFSVGASWNINKEAFYHSTWLTYLRTRATFGYNGNVNPLVAPVAVLSYQYPTGLNNNLPSYTYIGQFGASNAQLRPEKTGTLNLGLDWGIKNGRISGSFQYYDKRTSALLIGTGIDPTTGLGSATINIADMHGRGEEIDITSVNIKANKFTWTTNLNLAHNREIVTKLYNGPVYPANAGTDVEESFGNYVIGQDLERVYAYRWAGLDPQTGDPRGYVDGKPTSLTSDYNGYLVLAAIQSQPQSTVHYMGSAVPVLYGAVNNTFTYGPVSIYAMILYKLGYVFRKPPEQIVNYTNLYAAAGGTPQLQPIAYEQRWQKPGDELHTNVPSAIYAYAPWRDEFYQSADINVLPADHIRLQEVNLSYTLKSEKWIKNPTIGLHVSNLGILWRKNKEGLDPDVYDLPQPRTYSLAFNCSF